MLDRRQVTKIDLVALSNKTDDFFIEVVRGEILVSISSWVEGEPCMVQFNHNFSNSSFGEWISLLLLS